MRDNDGKLGSVLGIYLHRAMRFLPLYMFVLLFFWKFVPLFGNGPMFFEFSEFAQCNERWYWHLLFLNNIIPWAADDNCMGWTWFIANDFQFFLMVPLLCALYYRGHKQYAYLSLGILAVLCVGI
jgi:peptidoglycan/LPS O-acetylase OafA/YrhL